MRGIAKGWLGLAAVCLWATSAAALTDEEKCQADKLKTAGKYAFCRMKTESKAIKSGRLSASSDYRQCAAKYGVKWGGAEAKAGGTCPLSGDQAAVQTEVAGDADVLMAVIGGSPSHVGGEKCEAAKLKTAGKYTYCRLNAEAKAIKTGEAADYSKCDAKYGTKWSTVESKAGGTCPVTGDQVAIQTQAIGYTGALSTAIGGSPLPARFVDNADGTITDIVSGLMWEKKTELDGATNLANLHDADNAHPWSGTCTVDTDKRCQPSAAAAALCAAHFQGDSDGCAECTGGEGTCNLPTTMWATIAGLNGASFAGHTDWRAPRLQEVRTITDYADTTSPTINAAFDGASCGAACTDIASATCSCTAPGIYWSATSVDSADLAQPHWAWGVYIVNGDVSSGYKANSGLFVRAVRGGP